MILDSELLSLMTTILNRFIVGRFVAVISLLFLLVATSVMADQKVPELTVDGETYTDVTITSKSATDLFITHSGGFASLKVYNLDMDTKILLGYESAKPKTALPANIDIAQISEDPKVEEVRQQVIAQWEQYLGGVESTHIIAVAAAIGGLLYLFTCFCFQSICKKTGNEPGLLVWLPILQMFPLLKAAGMPAWWFFIFLISSLSPLIGVAMMNSMGPSPILLVLVLPHLLAIVGSIIWCFKIFQARGMSMWLGIFLLLPVTNIFAFLYLAFGSSPVHNVEKSERGKTERWSKNKAQDTNFFFQS